VIVKLEWGVTKAWSGCLAPQVTRHKLPGNESLTVLCPEVNILLPTIYSGLGRCKPIMAEAVGGKTTYIKLPGLLHQDLVPKVELLRHAGTKVFRLAANRGGPPRYT
jgi:hypothetical protein